MPESGFNGTVTGLSLPEIIQLYCTSQRDVKLSVHSPYGDGTIFIASGQIIHAETSHKKGESAFYTIMSWDEGEFKTLTIDDTMPIKPTIHSPWEQLLLEAMRVMDENRAKPDRQQAGEQEQIVVYCQSCQKRFYVPAEKIPLGKKVKAKCPVCKSEIIIEREEEIEDVFAIEIEKWRYEEAETTADFSEFYEGVLICTADEDVQNTLKQQFESEGYQVHVVNRSRDAFFALRKGEFRIVVLDEGVDGGGHHQNVLLYYLQRLPGHIRRNFCLCLLSDTEKTRDTWAAFKLGVDVIVNRVNLSVLSELVHYTLNRLKQFYEPYLQELEILRTE
ncbi:MAG: DUF4388 domain-containing protein [Deltaproteobacteria bacterium]|nr:DUF4388 domain-containing protein [Deltaproteobacteria bacterium]MBW2068654.1 DUF4388 domain-containing protein [Deltaproteobacteria bacterium]